MQTKQTKQPDIAPAQSVASQTNSEVAPLQTKSEQTKASTPQEYAQIVALEKGWNYADWQILIHKESSWNTHAVNKSSGACGLAQALPCQKMLNVIGTLDNYQGQIDWMADYLQNRYGNPTNALIFHQTKGWY